MVRLEICVWHDSGYDTTYIDQPSKSDLGEAIRLLDGADRNDLYLRSNSGQWMGFGGGPDQVIVTYADGEAGPFYEAVSGPEAATDPVRIRVGGQDIDVPPHMLLAPDDAVAAAIDFTVSEARPEALAWLPR